MFSIQEVANLVSGTAVIGANDSRISNIHFDSRSIEKNGLFVALTSGNRNGHEFIDQAKENGASAALISDESYIQNDLSYIVVKDTERAFQLLAMHYREQSDIPLIAITGSNGKTSTKDMVSHLLSQRFRVHKTEGNFNNHLGAPLSLLSMKKEHEMAVIELGMNHAGEIDFLASLAKPTHSIITNIGDAHIEFFENKEGIAHAKAEILPHTAKEGFSFLPGDSEFIDLLTAKAVNKVITFGFKEHNDIVAKDIQMHENSCSFLYESHTFSHTFTIPLVGKHNVHNILPAIFLSLHYGMTAEDIQNALISLQISHMRFQPIMSSTGGVLISDCYNASPTSMVSSIDTLLESYPNYEKYLVLGDMFELGEKSKELHQEVGIYIKDKDVHVVTLGNHAEEIASVSNGTHFKSQEDVVSFLQEKLHKRSVCLFKASRGMKFESMVEELSF